MILNEALALLLTKKLVLVRHFVESGIVVR
jgi:hypothetical protein